MCIRDRYVEAGDQPVFLPVHDALLTPLNDLGDGELTRLNLQYRNRLEFAIGRTCSASWLVDPGARAARRLWTTWLPIAETPQTQARSNQAVITDMRALTSGSVDELREGLTPIVSGYGAVSYTHLDVYKRQPLHWAIQLPDVMERGGFDAVIGNPPFLGGKKITGALGRNLRDWYLQILAAGKTGNADMVAYFFLRAHSLLRARGNLGLIATNTIAQGETREVGLDQVADRRFTITRSIQSRSWPAQGANLAFAAIWGTKGPVSAAVPRFADNAPCSAISTLLELSLIHI